ncbi:MAG: UbiD family decarboxylase [Peptostreptococcaceae bacterium]
MDFKEILTSFFDKIDQYKKVIVTTCLSILGIILLSIIFILSSDKISVSDEADILLSNIEKRQYSIALEQYQNYQKEFSESKSKRLDKVLSGKLNKLLLQKGDDYLSGQMSKEAYIGLINTINAFNSIDLELKLIEEQVERVDGMYLNEDIDYDIAISYINTVSTLNRIGNSLEKYRSSINKIYEIRTIYEIGLRNEQLHKYYEAIKEYEKIGTQDKKYNNLAKQRIDACKSIMYDYYIESAEDSNRNGNYEDAIRYINYLKEYFPDDDALTQFGEKYQENMALYTLTMDDILNLLSSKTGDNKDNLSIDYFQQMINENKFYYVEFYKYGLLIDELLVDARTREIYSYKDETRNYNNSYSDGFFRVMERGDIQFAISEDEATFLVERHLDKNFVNYKDVESVTKEKIYRYIGSNNVDVDKILEEAANVYHYNVVSNGWFSKKSVYLINMYTKEIYLVGDETLEEQGFSDFDEIE